MRRIKKQLVPFSFIVFILAMLSGMIFGAENMIGRQSQNEGIFAVPAPDSVAIDGDLDDWDLSGQIWSFADLAVRDHFSVKTAAMWDKENLYLSFYWKDPTPMHSTVNPDFDPDKGWVADAIQLRVTAGGQTGWFDTWYYAPAKRAVFQYNYWKDESSDTKGLEHHLLTSQPGEVDMGEGIQLAYKTLPEGDGYIEEICIPWNIIYKKKHLGATGDTFRMGMEFLWGRPSGDTWPIHRYADNMAQDETSREFFWTGKRLWGEVRLLDQNNIEPRRYIADEDRPEGSIPVRAILPNADREFNGIAGFTLVIEDENGKRVRNLAGDFDPREYAVKDAPMGTIEVAWNGLDDNGTLVLPGKYTVRGLLHGPLGADFERTFYNPGIPPWGTADGSGAWGADHSAVQYATRCGDWIVLASGFAEGGVGMMGIDAEGRKRWGERRGVTALASNDSYIYSIPNSWHTTQDSLLRMVGDNGKYAPFMDGDEERTLEYPINEILTGTKLADFEQRGHGIALAATQTQIALLFAGGRIALLDAETAEFLSDYTIAAEAKPAQQDQATVNAGMVFTPNGKRLRINWKNRLFELDLETGNMDTIEISGVEKFGAITFDEKGDFYVFDAGADQQIKRFDADGRLNGTIGAHGGRPNRGTFLENAVKNVSSIAVDANGEIWAVEYWDYPRRVSVWSSVDCSLVRDYIGNTGYSGTTGFLHEQDPSRGYVGAIEYVFGPYSRDKRVNAILWYPDRENGESFEIETQTAMHPSVFYSEASGTKHEYALAKQDSEYFLAGYTLFMREKGNDWRPVTMIGTVGAVSGRQRDGRVVKEPDGAFTGYQFYDGMFWNDGNRDGKVQFDECEIIETQLPGDEHRNGQSGIPVGNFWGVRMDPTNLSLYVFDRGKRSVFEYTPIGFTQEGAPMYGSKGMRDVGYPGSGGEVVPVPGIDIGIVLSGDDDGKLAGFSRSTGKELWCYPNPYHSVHGSHRATMPKPGLIIGPLKVLGFVGGNAENETYFGLRGNLGQDFYMTADGLFIGSMFLDGRLPPTISLPETEKELATLPLELFSNGSEAFNGWLGRQEDGTIRMTNAFGNQVVIVSRLRGFETIRRFDANAVSLGEEDYRRAEREDIERKQVASQKLEYGIKRKSADGWNDVPELQIRKAGQPAWTRARLAYDDERLYASFQVHNDPSPWKNSGKDFTMLFKTGDCIDIQLSPTANEEVDAKEGDQRILISQFENKPVAVLMRQVDPTAEGSKKISYMSPVMTREMDRVEIIKDADIQVHVGGGDYNLEISIPWSSIGMKPEKGTVLRGDLGFILSNDAGTSNNARVYWSNQDTNLVSDLPSEAILQPNRWASLRFE